MNRFMTSVDSRLQNIISQFPLSRVNNKQVKMSPIHANHSDILANLSAIGLGLNVVCSFQMPYKIDKQTVK